MDWKSGDIDGCIIRPLSCFEDARGWLCEAYRVDEIGEAFIPAMSYVSMTRPGIARGPHEHTDQADLFAFFDGEILLYLWDMRNGSPTYGRRYTTTVGVNNPVTVLVPAGVVHAYRNCGNSDALTINCPNRLYAGWNREEEVDEIRHEDDEDSPFRLD